MLIGTFRVDHYHHVEVGPGANDLAEIKQLLHQILGLERQEMATQAEIIALLDEANTATNEIAGDIEELLARPDVPTDVAERLQAHVDALKAVAAVVPEPESEPPVA